MTAEIKLREVAMFSQLSDEALHEIQAGLKTRHLQVGELLFNMGDPGDELVIVESGGVAIFVPDPEDPQSGQPIRVFRAGEMLGEMALIDQQPRSASARAQEDSVILTLSGEVFRHSLRKNPELAISVMAGLNDRIRYTTNFLGEVRNWVGRIADGDYQTQGVVESEKYQDQTLASLAAEFARMATLVKEREETLRREVTRLRIEIDEVKRKRDTQQIIGSEYYQSLKEKAMKLRQQKE